jgi:hypothetical protein
MAHNRKTGRRARRRVAVQLAVVLALGLAWAKGLRGGEPDQPWHPWSPSAAETTRLKQAGGPDSAIPVAQLTIETMPAPLVEAAPIAKPQATGQGTRGTVEFESLPLPPATPKPPSSPPRPQPLAFPDAIGPTGPLPAAEAPRGPLTDWIEEPAGLFQTPVDAPLGFTGRSSVLPREVQTDNHFVPVEDRWRVGFPTWDRYGKGHPPIDDYPYMEGRKWDPFGQNVLKGDYPILGQNTFFVLTATSDSLFEYHQVPIPTTPFESTANPRSYPFIGRPNQFVYQHNFVLSFDLFHGDASFKPVDWRIKLTPIFNINYLAGQEVGIVGPDVRTGVDRGRTFFSLQDWFVETKLADLGPNYDFVSVRAGSQPFTSDFRGFIFSDTNRAVRLFGNLNSNREQFNLAFFAQQEKDTNSGLNTLSDRNQRIVIGNLYAQDFVFPGYTAQASVHYNHDDPTFRFDRNNFLVRPDPVGVFQPHTLDVAYLGWTGDGHIDRININHAFYWALGHDSLNPLANRPQDISAQMAALELSYDRDWVRFRGSVFWSSGDRNPRNSHGTGFDSIFDNPNFAGGEFSYWQRQSIRILGVNLVNRESLIPDLRSSKTQGQSNFVNPGLQLYNIGADFEITPKLRLISNANFLWFDTTESLKLFTFQENIHRKIGTDLSLGFEYRPWLSNNLILKFGVSSLIPGRGFRDIYNNIDVPVRTLFAAFMDVELTY